MAGTDTDRRTVHVTMTSADGHVSEVVRYERSGKFFLEAGQTSKSEPTRKRLTLAEAARFAGLPGARWHVGKPGGMRFDAEVRKVRNR